jgi:hypothetical protein
MLGVCNIYFMYRPETPPNTPQRAQAAARQLERNTRTLDSPQHHPIPHQPVPPVIQPLHYNNVPMPHMPLLPANGIIPDDPFALPAPVPGPVHLNGHIYQHLPQHLAQQLQNLPALPPARGRGHGQLPPVSLIFLLVFYQVC